MSTSTLPGGGAVLIQSGGTYVPPALPWSPASVTLDAPDGVIQIVGTSFAAPFYPVDPGFSYPASFTPQGQVVLAAGTLNLPGGVWSGGTLVAAGGVLDATYYGNGFANQDPAVFENITLRGPVLVDYSKFYIAGTIDLLGADGISPGALAVETSSGGQLQSVGPITLGSGTLSNARGYANFSYGLTIAAAAAVDVTGFWTPGLQIDPVNNGTVTIEQGASLVLSGPLLGTGRTVLRPGGVLDVYAGGLGYSLRAQPTPTAAALEALFAQIDFAGGTLSVGDEIENTGSTLDLSGAWFTGGGVLSGFVNGGTVRFPSGASTGQALLSLTNGAVLTGGTFAVSGTSSINGSASIGAGLTIDIAADATFDAHASLLQNNGTIVVEDGGVLSINLRTLSGGGAIVERTGATLAVTGAIATSRLEAFAAAGSVHLDGATVQNANGTLDLSAPSPITIGAAVTIDDGSLRGPAGALSLDATYSGVPGLTLRNTTLLTGLALTYPAKQNVGQFTIAGVVDAGGRSGQPGIDLSTEAWSVVFDGGAVLADGTLGLAVASINVNQSATIAADATVDVSTWGVITALGYAVNGVVHYDGTLINQGSMRLGGGGQIQGFATLENDGLLTVGAGATLTNQGTIIGRGAISLEAGAVITWRADTTAGLMRLANAPLAPGGTILVPGGIDNTGRTLELTNGVLHIGGGGYIPPGQPYSTAIPDFIGGTVIASGGRLEGDYGADQALQLDHVNWVGKLSAPAPQPGRQSTLFLPNVTLQSAPGHASVLDLTNGAIANASGMTLAADTTILLANGGPIAGDTLRLPEAAALRVLPSRAGAAGSTVTVQRFDNFGTIDVAAGGSLAVNGQSALTFDNEGAVTVQRGASLAINASWGVFNGGTMTVLPGGSLTIAAPFSGSGVIDLYQTRLTLDLGGDFGTIRLHDTNSGIVLGETGAPIFGTLDGFRAGDSIDLPFASPDWASGFFDSGILALPTSDGADPDTGNGYVVLTLDNAVGLTADDFLVQSDGTGGSLITIDRILATDTPPTPPAGGVAFAEGNGSVAWLNFSAGAPAMAAHHLLDPLGAKVSSGAAVAVAFDGTAAAPSPQTGELGVLTSNIPGTALLPSGYGAAVIDTPGPFALVGGTADNETIAANAGGLVFLAQQGSGSLAAVGGNNVFFATSASDGSWNLAYGGGDDVVVAQYGNDTIATGGGTNTVWLGAGADSVAAQGSSDIIVGGSGAATVSAGAGAVAVFGGGGALAFVAGAGSATVVGGAGGTTMQGGNSSSVFFGFGPFSFTGAAAADTLVGGTGSMTVHGGSGGGMYWGGLAGGNRITLAGSGAAVAGGNNDVLTAVGPGNHSLYGETGAETLSGGLSTGIDNILAGSGNDLLIGSYGLSALWSGPGSDTLIAGVGPTLFEFLNGYGGGAATVSGFRAGIDHVVLAGFPAGSIGNVLQGAVSAGANTLLALPDGTRITFQDVTGLTAANFL